MVNNERIVPITSIDYLTMVGTMLNLAQKPYIVLKADDVEGNFTVPADGDSAVYLLNQPAKSINFADDGDSNVYFVADYDFKGISVNGVASELNLPVIADGITLMFYNVGDGLTYVTPQAPTDASNGGDEGGGDEGGATS